LAETPFGHLELERLKQSYMPGELPVVLEKLLRTLLGNSRTCRLPVAVGLPVRSVFFSTRPIHHSTKDPQPQVLLREALQSAHVRTETMQADLIRTQPGNRTVASIAACEQKQIEQLLAVLGRFGISPSRIEPGPWALHRMAGSSSRMGRPRSVLRVFLGQTEGLAMLVGGGLPLVWRSFDLPRGDEATAILSVSRSLAALSHYCGLDGPLDSIVIHGRNDLKHVTNFEWLQEQLKTSTQWQDGPEYDDEHVALGLAQGCLKSHDVAFDLAKRLKPRPSLSQIFPWGQFLTQAAMLLFLALFLWDKADGLETSYRKTRTRNEPQQRLVSLRQAELAKRKNELEDQAGAVQQFLGSRVLWTRLLRELPDRMPESMFLLSFQGECDLPVKDKKSAAKPKKSLVLRAATAMPKNGSMPPELDRFLDSLREDALLKKDFPQVELGGLQHFLSSAYAEPLAFFTVVCLPKTEASGKKKPAADKNS
jgi:hypothetical protein